MVITANVDLTVPVARGTRQGVPGARLARTVVRVGPSVAVPDTAATNNKISNLDFDSIRIVWVFDVPRP